MNFIDVLRYVYRPDAVSKQPILLWLHIIEYQYFLLINAWRRSPFELGKEMEVFRLSWFNGPPRSLVDFTLNDDNSCDIFLPNGIASNVKTYGEAYNFLMSCYQ